MKTLMIICCMFRLIVSQDNLSQSDLEMIYFERKFSVNEFQFTSSEESGETGFLLSLIVPGLDQFLHDRTLAASIYAGLEITFISMAISYHNSGEDYRRKMQSFANNTSTGFSRVKYYKNIYEAVNGVGSADDALFDLSADERSQYEQIRNSNIWNDLKHYEKEVVGDGVHSLPNSKTQQYYEMIGKYGMFYHGWRGLSFNDLGLSGMSSLVYKGDAPVLIDSYYRKRDKMNDAFKAGTIAFSGVFINHLISGLDALIDQKRRTKLRLRQDLTRLSQRVEMTYEF